MEQSGLNDYFTNPGKNEDEFFKKRDMLLLYLLKKKVSYPTEMARDLNISIEYVNELIYKCLRDELLLKLKPDFEEPQKILREQRQELNARGIIGFDAFTRFSWWTLSPIGFEFLKCKHKGEKLKIENDLAEYLGAYEQTN
jgi:hypothetical protein